MNYTTKDSGKREEFSTGSKRDTQDGKTRWDLMPWEEIERVADLYTRGAEKYAENNWKLGQPMKRTFASLMRHLMAFKRGEHDEDHGAAVIWNMLSLMWHEIHKPELNNLYEKPRTITIRSRRFAVGSSNGKRITKIIINNGGHQS